MARGGSKWRRGLAIGAAAAAAMTAAEAAPPAAQLFSAVEYDGVRLSVTPREVEALQELGNALRGSRGAQDKALAKARLAATGVDAIHWLTLLEFELGRRRNDDALRATDVALNGVASAGTRRHLGVRSRIERA